MPSRADLHVHSKYSDRPSEWILRRIGAPECFVEPMHVYTQAKAAGMDFITISDHNCIDGALEIAHLPNTFISNEVTTYFPENGCKIHCLVTGITPEQFGVIQQVRENIYDFRRYLLQENIIYSVAHPLFTVNERLTVDLLEKLLVMFNRFEGINGTRDPRAADMVNTIFRALTPEFFARLVDKHGIAPVGDRPWKKSFTGGSDDHSGIYVASAYTVTPVADTVEQYLNYLRAGDHEMGGESGTSLQLAHCFYSIAYGYYKDRFMSSPRSGTNLLGELLKQLLERPQPQPQPSRSVTGRVRSFVGRIVRARKIKQLSDVEQVLVEEFTKLFDGDETMNGSNGQAHADERGMHLRSFHAACKISQQLGYTFFGKFLQTAQQGRLVESLQTVASLAPVALSIAPYLAAFKTQHKDEKFLQEVARAFPAANHLERKSQKRAWITDTFNDVNGVAKMIHAISHTAHRQGHPLTVVSCVKDAPKVAGVTNFEPVGEFQTPEYDTQKLSFPPFLEIMAYLEREKFSELIVSTPGPMGLTALAASRLMGTRIVGFYHTDFPAYVKTLTEDHNLELLTWRYMLWFFDQMDAVIVPSEDYRRQLIDHGFTPSKLRVMPRGVDTERFSPSKRDPAVLRSLGARGGTTFLYVGRVSREKNVQAMLEAFDSLLAAGHDASLLVVGDGPQLPELKRRHRGNDRVVFTGFLDGDTLAAAYASSDVFVFPSTTDTLGNAVLEAQASGLPCIVTDRGGPQEVVGKFGSGLVVNLEKPGALASAMAQLLQDEGLRRQMSQTATRSAQQFTWDRAVEEFWEIDHAPQLTPRDTTPQFVDEHLVEV